MKKAIVSLVVIAAVATAGIYFYPRYFKERPKDNTLRISGNIEAHESVLSFKVQGRIVDLPVEEGQWVEAGAVLARLDNQDYRQQVALDEAAVHTREAELKLALAGSREQEIQAAEQTVLDARADLEQKKLDYERAKQLYAEDAVPKQSLDIADTNLKRTEAALRRAQEILNEAREGTRKEQTNISRASVRQAGQGLELSRIKLGYTVLRAPKAGVVVVRQAELGEVMAPGTPVVTLAAGLAVADAISEIARKPADLRWPNDVLLDGRKCSGILPEMTAEGEYVKHLVLGVGINVNQRAFPPGLAAEATSLARVVGRRLLRAEVLAAFLRALDRRYRQFLEAGSDAVIADFQERSTFACGRRVSVENETGAFTGATEGLDSSGFLLVRRDDTSAVEAVLAGTIRPVE